MIPSNDLPLGRLLANIARLQFSLTDQLMDQIGLYRGQAILLLIVSKNSGLTHSEISRKLQISPAATTKVIQRLEKLRYLQRRPDPDDERISRVFIQAEGQAVIEQIHEVFQELEDIILTGISNQEQDCLRALLTRIHANLQNGDYPPNRSRDCD